MATIFGIRREDKNKWERRVPVVPADVAALIRDHGLAFHVQPSPIRVFTDAEYAGAGATVTEDLARADIVLAVKEIPEAYLLPRKVYVFFSHTAKGQDYNMPMLRHILDQGATLIDYERVVDEHNRRLIFFGVDAGHAGMIECLRCFGQRLAHLGQRTPFAEVLQPWRYGTLAAAEVALRAIGQRIASDGLGDHRRPVIFGIAGYGNVSQGCQDVLDWLPVREVAVADLPAAAAADVAEVGPLLKVVFREEHMAEPKAAEAQFALQDYYQRPENYRGVFARHLPHLDILMNTIYWDDRYPRLVTRRWARSQYGDGHQPRLQVIGDISCDIGGGIELNVGATDPDEPCYVFEPGADNVTAGVAGEGPVVMTVDNLPCELPREASTRFSGVLRDMVPALAAADFAADFASLHLPGYLKRAVVAHRGELTPAYRYLQANLDRHGR